MTKKLEGKTAVITGGTEGIGLATARRFVEEGAYVFITGRRQNELDEAVKAIGANVSGVEGDIAQLADLDRLYETVAQVKRRIDIVFANAGVGEFVPFGAVTEEHFDRLFNINVRVTLFTVQKALPLLNDGGSIILNGSVASVKGTAAFGVYAASKAALRSFVRTWTTDLKDRHIRSNVVSPGPIGIRDIRGYAEQSGGLAHRETEPRHLSVSPCTRTRKRRQSIMSVGPVVRVSFGAFLTRRSHLNG